MRAKGTKGKVDFEYLGAVTMVPMGITSTVPEITPLFITELALPGAGAAL
ncbi:MAG: hypothetical protein AB9903_09265 [Vulcanimicrobiota bacterium]